MTGPGSEIERAYLRTRMPRLPSGAVRMGIAQGWLPGERLQERVRRIRRIRRDGRATCVRTVTPGRGTTRTEVEETDEWLFRPSGP